jgi:hypothetical protein
MPASVYPLQWPEGWPRTPPGHREANSPFLTSFEEARRELLDELKKLRASNSVVSSCVPVRSNGEPKGAGAEEQVGDPGVAVYATLRGRPLVLARDLYESVPDNLRLITLTLSHLCGIERHGGETMMQRALQGFSESPWAAAVQVPPPSWCGVLRIPPDSEKWMIEAAYRHWAKERHPDAGGSDAMMAKLNAARDAALQERE